MLAIVPPRAPPRLFQIKSAWVFLVGGFAVAGSLQRGCGYMVGLDGRSLVVRMLRA